MEAEPLKDTPSGVMEASASRRVIWKSVSGVTLGFFLTWCAVAGLSIIQSSVIGQVGTIGLSFNFALSVVGCTVLAPMAGQMIGYKYSMIVGFVCIMLWEATNLYPVYWTVIPGAIVSGAAMGCMWANQGSYISQQGHIFAKLTGEDSQAVIGRFFGIFFAGLGIGKHH